MSILFRDGFADPSLIFNGVKMFIGFVLMAFAGGLWVAIPLLNGSIRTHGLFLKMSSNSKE